jgi:hypothetical protein
MNTALSIIAAFLLGIFLGGFINRWMNNDDKSEL